MRIASFNLAYHVMANQVQGSEAEQVELCRAEYASGGFECTRNAAKFLSQYDLFGLQEVNPNFRATLEADIRKANPSADFKFFYVGRISVGYNRRSISGPANQIWSGLVSGPDDRDVQAIYFEKPDLLLLNLHAPHGIDIKRELEKIGRKLQKLAQNDLSGLKIVCTGDFNDFRGLLAKQKVELLGHFLRVPGGKLVETCCTDSGFSFPGDYVLSSENVKVLRYGLPRHYKRGKPLMSDHDPITLEIEM